MKSNVIRFANIGNWIQAIACLAVIFGLLSAPVVARATELPSGESVVDGYVKAIGGKEKLEAVKTRKTTGVMKVPMAGLEGKLEVTQVAPNKSYTKMELPGIGVIESGFDGKVAWEKNALTGDRELDGKEKEQTERMAFFHGESKWREVYPEAKTTGQETISGKSCYVVELTGKDGNKVTNYYDEKTSLLVRSKMVVVTPQGDLAAETDFEDYREVDGIKYPFKTTMSIVSQQQIIELKSVEHPKTVDEKIFSQPE